MATIQRFEDLECWQEARKFVKLIYEFTKKEKFRKDFELINQIRRSSVSSMANIAEGFHRNSTKDFMRFLDYSRASIAETVSHLYVALDQDYIEQNDLNKAKGLADVVWKKVNNFITYLNKIAKQRKQLTNRTNKTNATNTTIIANGERIMKHSRNAFILIIVAMFLLTGCASQQSNVAPEAAALTALSSGEPAPYFIQPGDQLDIKFFYNPELNETLTVRPDGKMSLQLVDEVQAAGLKPSQLDKVLTEKYAYELKKPVITVIVKSFGGQRIFVGGEVNKQGLITIAGNMTPLQAVLNAGGFKETANPESTIIIRKGLGNKPVPIAMNLEDAMHGKSGSADFLLQPDDIVYVPKSAIAKANKFVNQYIENLLLFRGVSLGFSYELHSESNY